MLIENGRDTFAAEQYPEGRKDGAAKLLLSANSAQQERGWIYLGLPSLKTLVAGRTVVSATLWVKTTGISAQTWAFALISEGWNPATLKWSRRPAAAGLQVNVSAPAAADEEAIPCDITTLVQAVADGWLFRGIRMTTDSTAANRVYGFDSGDSGWVLEIELSEVPDEPTALSPAGIVGAGEMFARWVFDNAGIQDLEQDAYRILIDPNDDEVTPAFDTGWIDSPLSESYLPDFGFAAVSPGAVTRWTVQVRANGVESAFADWAEWTYDPNPVITITSPVGGTLFDVTPIIECTSDKGVNSARILVYDQATPGRLRYSFRQEFNIPQTSFSFQIPFLNRRGQPLLRKLGSDYRIEVWGIDRTDREPAPGTPPYGVASKVVQITGGATPPPATLGVSQVGDTPTNRFVFSRSEAADYWVVERDGQPYAVVDHADVAPVATGVWSWDDHQVRPWSRYTYGVRAGVDDGTSRTMSEPVTTEFENQLVAVWLRAADGTEVKLGRTGLRVSMKDRRTTHDLPYAAYTFQILTAFEGYSGTYEGAVNTSHPGQEDAYEKLMHIKGLGTEPVRVAWGNVNKPFILENLNAVASSTEFTPQNRIYEVSFGLSQSGEFEVEV